MCLLTFHIFNLFGLISICFITSYFDDRWHKNDTDFAKARNSYYQALFGLLSHLFDVYSDIFLLWLLYKFMKPQKILNDGRTLASATLFAHDHKAAGVGLLESLKKKNEDKQATIIQREAKDFLQFVIKEWTNELGTEQSIGFEFLSS